MNEIAYVNGEWGPLAEARVPIDDRGFLFGDGVYEVVRGYDGRLWALDRHWRRLERSLAELGIGGVDLDALQAVVLEAVERAETPEPLVYIQVTRGVAPRSHDWDDGLNPTVVVTVREAKRPSADQRAHGVSCVTVADQRWKRCDVKSINLLANVMAKHEAHRAGAYEAIFYEPDGTITEGSSTSVFIVREGRVRTHAAGNEILPSISRDFVLELAGEMNLRARPWAFHLEALLAADEVFIASTTAEVLGVVKVDDRTIGNGQVGPVTRRLADAYEHAVREGRDAPRT